MKRKIIVQDKTGSIEKEINIRQKEQYDALLKFKSRKFKDKKKYSRKQKYKKLDDF